MKKQQDRVHRVFLCLVSPPAESSRLQLSSLRNDNANIVLCSTFWTFIILCLFWREKVAYQSQQMKRLLSSCWISRAIRKQEWSMSGPTACVSKHPSEIYWIPGCSPRCSLNVFLSMGRGQRCGSTTALWCRVPLVMNLKPPLLEQELSLSIWTLSSKGHLWFLKESQSKPAFILSVQLVVLCWVVKDFWNLICQRALAEEISADNNGDSNCWLVV